jgi:hypothetical protein
MKGQGDFRFSVVAMFLLCMVTISAVVGEVITVDDDGEADFGSIQAAIDDANDGDTVVVKPGTYYENVSLSGKLITLTGIDADDPSVVAGTIIDGQGLGSCVTFSGTETSDCILTGFTLTNGEAVKGGGIYGGSPDGPGASGTEATIIKNVIFNNYATGSGGGIANCDGLIQSNVVELNTAENAGGGIWHCDGLIQSNVVTNNWSLHQGAGICGCFDTIEYNVISWNITTDWGGGINKSLDPNGVIRNNTIVDNLSGDRGGGLCDCLCPVSSCIIWGNSAPNGPQQYNSSGITFSCIEGGLLGLGNWSADPCFAYPAMDDYHLKSEAGRWDPCSGSWVQDGVTSFCIDSGNPNDPNWTNGLWPDGGRINMGAYGGTAQASMSLSNDGNVADLNHDGAVDFLDLEVFCEEWPVQEVLLSQDMDRNGVVDGRDYAILALNWPQPEEPEECSCSNRTYDWTGHLGVPDGIVDISDMSYVLSVIGACGPPLGCPSEMDYNCDGIVDQADAELFVAIIECFGVPYVGSIEMARACCESATPQ